MGRRRVQDVRRQSHEYRDVHLERAWRDTSPSRCELRRQSDEPHTAWVTDQRFDLDKDLAPGTSQTVEVTVAAPADPGQYFLRHRMVKEGVLWFDESDAVSVAVSQTAHDESLARSPLFLATAAAVLGAAGAGLAFAARRRSRERGA